MTTSFLKLSQQPIFASSQYRTNHRSKSNPAMVVKLFSVILPTIEIKENSPEPKKIIHSSMNIRRCQTPALLNQKTTVGIIGGFSAFSTQMFLEKLVLLSSRGGKESVHFIVCNDPSLASFKDVHTNPNRAAIIANLRRKRLFLEQSGARCIVMACDVLQLWYKEVSEDCAATFLHIGDCVARELKEAELKPLEAGGSVQIGLLAEDPTLLARVYQEKLHDQGFEVVLPDKPTMEHMVIPAIEALKNKDTEGARNLTRIAIQALLVMAVNRIILDSHHFQGLLPLNDPLLSKCIDPIDVLARSTIKWVESIENNSHF